jgi:hypothetical protein
MKPTSIFIALLITISFFGQQPAWKELNDFHEMVSKVLHPVESGNLQPLKKNSAGLLEKALEWKNSTAPVPYQYPAMKADMDKLITDCTKLNDAVKAKKNKAMLKQLAMQTHDQFHAILSAAEAKKK